MEFKQFMVEMAFVEPLYQKLWKKARKAFVSSGYNEDDLKQECWVKAWTVYQSIKDTHELEIIKKIINKSVVNRIMDILDKCMVEVQYGVLNTSESEPMEEVVVSQSTWLTDYRAKTTKSSIVGDILISLGECLSEKEQLVITERLLKQKSFSEIAEDHGDFLRTRKKTRGYTHSSAVRKIYNKAIEKLKNEIGE